MSHESAWAPLSVRASSQVVSPRNKHPINCCKQKVNGADHRKAQARCTRCVVVFDAIQASLCCVHGGAALRLCVIMARPPVAARRGRTKNKKRACAHGSSECEGSMGTAPCASPNSEEKKNDAAMWRSVSTAFEDGEPNLRHPKKLPRQATSSMLALLASRAASNVA